MANADLKTKPSTEKVSEYLDSLEDSEQREQSKKIVKIMSEVSGDQATMWGETIIAFGEIHLKYESGRELDWFKIGLAPRKHRISLYVLNRDSKELDELLDKLGKHKRGKGCLYLNSLEDVDMKVLKKICELGVKDAEARAEKSSD